MVRLRFPAKLLFTIVLAGCGDGDPAADAPVADGPADAVATVDSRADGSSGQDACGIPCGGPFFDAAPGIDAEARCWNVSDDGTCAYTRTPWSTSSTASRRPSLSSCASSVRAVVSGGGWICIVELQLPRPRLRST